ncbi:hypothetical protein CPTMiller_00251 [Citrobacter phage Miller]|uniref:Uncharacterized protein n=2 Tax=Pseudotevenvirus miller TaxID=2843956 RepID=A0A076YK73_9CAUD|nr:hypothetical protein CPTMiller_00251 [Citrobacter phage Miller]AIK68187.1 hypothetical protein CPTMiller_00251 [Citrobacter phage Miller]
MMLWTKDKFVFRDDESFGTLYRNLALRGGPLSPSQLSSVVFPITVTHCDRFGVNGFVDFNGTTWYSDNSFLFKNEDRNLFKKHIEIPKPIVDKPINEDVQQLLDCAHLLGKIYVEGKLVTKPGDLERMLRKQRDIKLKETERHVDTLTKSLEESQRDLKFLRGE